VDIIITLYLLQILEKIYAASVSIAVSMPSHVQQDVRVDETNTSEEKNDDDCNEPNSPPSIQTQSNLSLPFICAIGMLQVYMMYMHQYQ
jgi:hypothetical protein